MPSTDTKSEGESSLLNLKDELLTLASLRRVVTKDSMDSTSEQWIAHAKSSSKNESMAYSKGKMHGGHKILEFADGLWLGQEQQQTMTIIKDHLHPMMIDEDVEFLGDDGSFYATDDDKPNTKTATTAKPPTPTVELDLTPNGNGHTKNTKKKSPPKLTIKEKQRERGRTFPRLSRRQGGKTREAKSAKEKEVKNALLDREKQETKGNHVMFVLYTIWNDNTMYACVYHVHFCLT